MRNVTVPPFNSARTVLPRLLIDIWNQTISTGPLSVGPNRSNSSDKNSLMTVEKELLATNASSLFDIV